MVEVGTRVFMGGLKETMGFEKKYVGSKKTHKSKSISQSKGKRL